MLIVINSFIEVSGKDERSRNLNYLIAKIRNDLYSEKLKLKSRQKEKIININRKDEKLKGIEMARREYEKVKEKLSGNTRLKIKEMLDEGKWLGVMGILNKQITSNST